MNYRPMPYRLVKILEALESIEWRVLAPATITTMAISRMDLVYRFVLPIASMTVWVFLKPHVEKLRKRLSQIKFKTRNMDNINFWDAVKSLRSFIWAVLFVVFFIVALFLKLIPSFPAAVFYFLIAFIIILINALISKNSEADKVIWFLRKK